MAIMNPFQRVVGNKTADTPPATVDDPDVIQARADDKEAGHTPAVELTDKGEKPAEDAQAGVQKIEAVTIAWNKKSVYMVLIFIWLLTLVNNLKSSVVYSLSAYATSSFAGHSLLTVVSIVSSAMTGAVYIPMAKALDLWGRAESLLLMVVFCILGIVLLASSQNLPTYCAGEVFYSVGFGGLSYSWNVLAADVSNLRNRGLAFAFTSSPAIISAFAGSKAAEGFLNNVNWRWGYAVWAIIVPVFALPIYFLLAHNLRKAEKEGIINREKKPWKFDLESIWCFIKEFDLVGVFLFAGGMVVFLLPFTLANMAPNGWNSGYIIAMIVVGLVLLISFGLYEIYLAPVPFLNYKFLADRTVLGACLLNMTYQMSYYSYGVYLPSFLQVVYNVDVATAGYIGNIFSVAAFFSLFFAGWLIRVTGRFKWILWVCVPLYIFGIGLMIHFRQPGGNVGYIVMCEIFFSIAGSVFILCVQLAVLATVDHQHVAAVLALLFVTGSIGGSMGSAICGAIWTNTFLPQLAKNLPEAAMPNLSLIYSSLPQQLSYAVGTPERDAIVKSYGYAQPRMLAAGTALMSLAFIWVAMIKNLNVKNMTQTKGNVL
ncbi:Major facilitator superfamily domain general substrate transporter [Penicillium paradoxum]|uniref:Major facilitator superfamily domain general substrate transporter n=1 Tax=Penicillium paradoxum TaxID=176176 RepID=UPI00254978EA|nr:Major facilitator superfamily domain general substrate transporter [Penicillium paradoxum]KAJ5794607.1 Major facilitator superfamily domain general substrate transporter [Penicillium paradoxum]